MTIKDASMRLPREIGPIHFVGIGGIGMSGIAEVLCNLGYTVQGSDASESGNVARLREKGITVSIGHKAENVDGADVVVVSTAIKRDNPELMAARAQRIPVVRRAEMLAELMRLKSCVAIAGTHGKTTTTTMVATLLDAGDLDPTVINGGIINAYGSNARLGAGDWMVVEADESDGTFLKLPSDVAIVTNVDPEHLDHFKTFEAIQDAFRNFVENVPFYGFAVMCIDHPVVQTLVGKIEDRRIITYGENPQADARLVDLTPTGGGSKFKVVFRNRKTDATHEIADIMLPMPGRHNASNATAAIAVAHELGISDEAIRKAIAGFGGVKRRFTRTGEWNGVTVIDDYGHHPVEIAAVLKAARESTNGKIVAVVQPHRFTRLQSLFEEFCTCFNDADAVVVAEVYPAGEAPIEGIDRDHFVLGLRAHGHREVIPLQSPAELAKVVHGIAGQRRSRRLPGRRQHHAMGLRVAGRIEGAGLAVAFPDITPELKAAMPQLRGRLLANQSLAELTWFRVGGPAQVLFTPADEDDLAYFLKHASEGVAGLCRRRRLQPDRARRRHGGRGDPAVAAGVRRDVRFRRYRQRGHGRARQARGGDRGSRQYRRHGILLRHSRHHRRRAADECRRQWQRDQGRSDRGRRHRPRRHQACLRQCRHEVRLSQQRRRPVDHFHLGALSRRRSRTPRPFARG